MWRFFKIALLLSVMRGCQHAGCITAITVRLHCEYAPCCCNMAPFKMASCPLFYVKFVYIECEHRAISKPCLLLDNLKILPLARFYTLRFSACPYFGLSRRSAGGRVLICLSSLYSCSKSVYFLHLFWCTFVIKGPFIVVADYTVCPVWKN